MNSAVLITKSDTHQANKQMPQQVERLTGDAYNEQMNKGMRINYENPCDETHWLNEASLVPILTPCLCLPSAVYFVYYRPKL